MYSIQTVPRTSKEETTPPSVKNLNDCPPQLPPPIHRPPRLHESVILHVDKEISVGEARHAQILVEENRIQRDARDAVE